MEAKLKEYRSLRRRKEFIDNAKQKFEESKEKMVKLFVPNIFKDDTRKKSSDDAEALLLQEEIEENIDKPVQQHLLQVEEQTSVASAVSELESFEEPPPESWRRFITRWLIYLSLWLIMYSYFLKIQFGAVYFVVTVLIGIYLNTRTRPKKEGEVSAYSVFNENCKSIDGAITAEQFEREIRYGPGTVTNGFWNM